MAESEVFLETDWNSACVYSQPVRWAQFDSMISRRAYSGSVTLIVESQSNLDKVQTTPVHPRELTILYTNLWVYCFQFFTDRSTVFNNHNVPGFSMHAKNCYFHFHFLIWRAVKNKINKSSTHLLLCINHWISISILLSALVKMHLTNSYIKHKIRLHIIQPPRYTRTKCSRIYGVAFSAEAEKGNVYEVAFQ